MVIAVQPSHLVHRARAVLGLMLVALIAVGFLTPTSVRTMVIVYF